MNRSLLSTLFLLLVLSCFVNAQLGAQSVPAKRKYKYPGKIESNYDKTKDETWVFFNLMRIPAATNLEWEGGIVTSDERVGFSMYFTYRGQKLTTPKWIGIGIASVTHEPKQYGDYKLTIVADNETLTIGTLTVHDKGTTRSVPPRPVAKVQELEGSIPYEQFLQIANARKVKMQIGYKELPLDTENLEAIRDLASHTVP